MKTRDRTARDLDEERFLDPLVRERHASLGQVEHAQLERAATASVALRAAMLAHQEFEQRGAVQAGDDEICRRILDAAESDLGWRQRPKAAWRLSPGRRRFWRWAAPIGFFAAGAAAAVAASLQLLPDGELPVRASTLQGRSVTDQSSASQSSANQSSASQSSASQSNAEKPSTPSAVDSPRPPRTGSGAHGAARLGGTKPSPRQATPTAGVKAPDKHPTAKQLFTLASQHKSSGKWSRAAELYSRLLQLYPSSEYAAVAQMALGKHALRAGNPSSALHHFRTYQQRSSQSMTAEAMWGEAQALKALGRRAESERVRRELERRFPRSPYAER